MTESVTTDSRAGFHDGAARAHPAAADAGRGAQ